MPIALKVQTIGLKQISTGFQPLRQATNKQVLLLGEILSSFWPAHLLQSAWFLILERDPYLPMVPFLPETTSPLSLFLPRLTVHRWDVSPGTFISLPLSTHHSVLLWLYSSYPSLGHTSQCLFKVRAGQ